MTDRELLELAAKAARIKCDFVGEAFIGKGLGDEGRDWPWNPLSDDGDALRLAVKLGIQVGPNPASREPMCFAWPRQQGVAAQYETYGDDPYAATRRAIVMASAEIGKDMK
jgi:hypothetical protein